MALFTAACVSLAGVEPIKVQGNAMLPALKNGELILLDREVDKLARGDIVFFHFPPDPSVSYIKRIVALPGETIEIRDGVVLINGMEFQESYIDQQYNQSQRSLEAIQLATDSYFVLGDNRDNSSDSRIWGPLQRKFIYGKYTRNYSGAK
jgi:signal peptidase I